LQLELDLRGALERNELRLAYQPVVSLDTGRIAGFEALARWQHPERGAIAPETFIGLAEETGLIVELGKWALAEACRQARTWRNDRGEPLSVNVNISPKQLKNQPVAGNRLQAHLARALTESRLEPTLLNLEVTENVFLDSAETEAELQHVRALGVGIQLDDFGTGYSSLGYLQRLPIDTIKIDRSFVSGRGNGIANPQIVDAILALAFKMGKRVTAEGVETADQLAQLRAMHCTSAQGYFLSRPVEESAARLLCRNAVNPVYAM
jgi:EAL domain-containing protein (putative c-di-GMP-specific phosphodiesterase class I)